MAGDWIKMRGNLWDDPRVSKLCDITGHGEAAIIGALYWLWAAADQHTEDGSMPGLTLRQIDRKTGVQGFGAAMVEIGWLLDFPDGVSIVNFTEHNGASAKRRSMDAQRKANSRSVSACDADKTRTEGGQDADEMRRFAELEKEKEKEKKEETKTARKRAAPAALVSVDNLVEAGVDRQHAADWLAVRKVKNLPLTATAWADTQAEAVKAGLTVAEAIKRAAAQGWGGFRASWLQQAEAPRNQGPPVTVPSTDTRADEFREKMAQRAAESTKPPAEVLAMVRKVRTA